MSSTPSPRRLMLAVALAAAFVGWGLWALVTGIGGDSKDPGDYSSCASLATSVGVDMDHAECVDDDGVSVIKFKDSTYGKRLAYFDD